LTANLYIHSGGNEGHPKDARILAHDKSTRLVLECVE
jgi:hypothetical protein